MKELDICTQGKSFRIHNSVIWNMLSSRRDKLFINVVEYIDSLAIGKGNFLSILESKYQTSVRLPSKRSLSKNKTLSSSFQDNWLKSHFDEYKQGILKSFSETVSSFLININIDYVCVI